VNKIFILFHFSYSGRSRNFRLNITGPGINWGVGALAKPVNRRGDFFPSRDGQGYKFFIHCGSEISTPHGST